MGRPYKRLKYDAPEKHKASGMMGQGEAVSMITDLLVPCGEHRDMRRQVDNHVRYAVKSGTLGKSRAGLFRFDEIAAWANEGGVSLIRTGFRICASCEFHAAN